MRNCLIYLVDALRYDAIETSNEPTSRLRELELKDQLNTPSMNKIYSSGISLPNHHSCYGSTPSSVASLLTGLYPREHHLYGYYRPIHPAIKTLPEYFHEMGFHTLYMNGHKFFNINGIRDRFQEYRSGNTSQLLSRIEELNREGKPVFAYYHSMDVHDPYLMSRYPQTFDQMDSAIEYANELCSLFGEDHRFSREDAYVVNNGEKKLKSKGNLPLWKFILKNVTKHFEKDQNIFPDPLLARAKFYTEGVNVFDQKQLAPLLKFISNDNFGEETVLFFTSDHGERAQNGKDRHAFYHVGKPIEELIRIPGILVNLDEESEQIRDWSLTSQVDVAPTLLSIFGYDVKKLTVSGENLTNSPPRKRIIYAEYNKNSVKATDSNNPVRDFKRIFPLEAITTWQAVIRSDGYKFYRFREQIRHEDFEKALDDFIRTIFAKLTGNWITDEEVHTIRKDFSEDTLDARRNYMKFLKDVTNSKKSKWKELYHVKHDFHENTNYLKSSQKNTFDPTVLSELEQKLDGRFPYSLDLNTPWEGEMGGDEQDEKQLKEALEAMGYL